MGSLSLSRWHRFFLPSDVALFLHAEACSVSLLLLSFIFTSGAIWFFVWLFARLHTHQYRSMLNHNRTAHTQKKETTKRTTTVKRKSERAHKSEIDEIGQRAAKGERHEKDGGNFRNSGG